ncbi:MAG: carboxyl transferase domain-containing protein, partial [Burkholderiales bacterium]
SEVMRALLKTRAQGISVIALIGGAFGCFGGTGIVARCCDAIIMSEEGRLGMSGPEVIETVMGVEELDSRDRALVWRTTGGKHRYLLGEADKLVDDDISAFREAAIELLAQPPSFSLKSIEREHARLANRLDAFGACHDATEIWEKLGVSAPESLALMDAAEFAATVADKRA